MNGTRTGTGQPTYADGSRYSGGWRGDRHRGRGAMLYANGNTYDGEWVSGRRTGEGTLKWFAPGRSGVYEGQWRNDRWDGVGKEFCAPENGVYGKTRDWSSPVRRTPRGTKLSTTSEAIPSRARARA